MSHVNIFCESFCLDIEVAQRRESQFFRQDHALGQVRRILSEIRAAVLGDVLVVCKVKESSFIA